MAFLDVDERLIVMDIGHPGYIDTGEVDYSLSADEMKRLREVGVRTILQPMWWDKVQEYGKRRKWHLIETGLEKADKAGMKVLLGCYQKAPAGCPEDWYQLRKSGVQMQHFSIWNEEANTYEERFIRELADRYASDTVLLQNTLISDGECLFHPGPDFSYNDPAARASFNRETGGPEPDEENAHNTGWLYRSILRKMRRYQGLLLDVQDHDEIWFQLHPFIKSRSAGTQYMPDLFRDLRAEWSETAINWLLYTFYEFPANWRQEQIDLARKWGVHLFVGAQHCHGLDQTVPQAKESGLGLLCGPRHNEILPNQIEIEPWMYEKMAWAVSELS